MVSTREVFAAIAGLCFLGGVLSARFDRGVVGSWLLTAGSAFATLWSLLSIGLPDPGARALSAEAYLAMAGMAVTGTIYYGYRAANGNPPT
jgi:hypothetical protein